MNDKYKVLIVGPAWVGDMVMSQTLFKKLKQQYQDRLELDVLASPWASGLVSRMPEVNEVLENPFGHGKLELFKRIKLGRKLRYKQYDHVFVLPNSLKSAIIPFFANIPKRTGFIGEFRYGLLNEAYKLDKQQLPLMIDRFCALANHGDKPQNILYPQLNIDVNNQKQLLSKFGLKQDLPIIAFCPAAEFGPAKRWFPEHFANLANLVADKGFQILILGSNKDIAISQKIIAQVKPDITIIDVCGKTSITDAIDLLGAANIVITNDSGLMHVACAVNTKVIAIYGSSSPNFTPPLSDKADILQIDLDCSPCFQRICKFGHYNCLKFITPQMVYERIKLYI